MSSAPHDPTETARTPRDVLADRIEQWAEDYHVYDYADRLLCDLDAAGFEVRQTPFDPENAPEEGATLLLAIYIPEESEQSDPDSVADGLIGALNHTRDRLSARRLEVSLIPSPQWVTPTSVAILRRAAQSYKASKEGL